MDLVALGTSPAVQNPGGACSGYLLSQGNTRLLVDCGHGVTGVLRTVTELPEITAAIISHMHPDHFFDLVPLAYGFTFQRLSPIPLYLPPGARELLESLEGVSDMPGGFFAKTYDLRTYDPAAPLQIGSLTITFAPTRHYRPGYGMRFSGADGRSLVYTSDTGWTDALVELARGASVLMAEATLPEYSNDHERDGHLTPELAGRMASDGGVECLILTHYDAGNAEKTARAARDAFRGRVELAREGNRFEI